ncbi:MAG: acyl carrier protein [Clostridiales Family XIII bacterium]|jgi:acyl carrier protein|nr:acyl carrier protein [Clostridiales Family XIII bacterium]
MSDLIDILERIRPDVDFTAEQALIDDGILSSFDIINIVTDINLAFSVDISVADLTPDNFNSAESMMALIESF